jgi:divalent metal cation (Fe/Co/Zn/Cd) transporter
MKQNLALRVSRINIFNNIVLAVSKIGIGVVAHSAALLNDGVNNAGDVISSVIASVGIAAAGKDSDAEHQYGHERLESVAAILLSGIIMVVGMGLLVDGVSSIIKGSYLNRPIPGVLAVIAAIISIVVKEIMFLYTRWAAKKTRSSALLASSWDSQSDVLATTGGLIGIVFARMGYPIADSIAAIIIALFIFRVGCRYSAMGPIRCRPCMRGGDGPADSFGHPRPGGVRGLDLLHNQDLRISLLCRCEISRWTAELVDEHSIAERVHHAIEKNFPQVNHCMVHVNPSKKKQ